MNLEKYTQKSQEALVSAQNLAQSFSHQAIEPAHILLALLNQRGWHCSGFGDEGCWQRV